MLSGFGSFGAAASRDSKNETLRFAQGDSVYDVLACFASVSRDSISLMAT